MSVRRKCRKPKPTHGECHCCRKDFSYCWKCSCGFAICQACMDENAWGMTCNWVTWTCPDCGKQRNY